MNTQDFIKIIRKVIREEVRSAIQSELKVITESSRPRQLQRSLSQKPVTKKQYSSNPTLNEILNDTEPFKGSISEGIDYNDYDEWPTMQNPRITRPRINDMLPETDTEGRYVSPENIPDHVINALTKDYSKLLDTMEERKK